MISTDDCLILSAFKDATSLREAAAHLSCDPAGLLRKVQRISDEHGFLQKLSGRWTLTASGKVMADWVEKSIEDQKKTLLGQSALRIATTMWLAEELVIPGLKNLKNKFSKQINYQISCPAKNFESHLLDGSCDFVIVCHPPEDPAIAHKQLFKEEWVVIAPKKWKEQNKSLSINDLLNRPFIRHAQVNPDTFGLNSEELSAITSMTVDNLISVRTAVKEGLGWSIVPRPLVSQLIKTGFLIEIKYSVEMDRKLCLWWLRSRSESKKLSGIISTWLLDQQD